MCCNCNIFPCSCYDINDSTFTRCRTRISHRLGPGGSTGPCCPSQSLVCMSGQAGQQSWRTVRLSESRVWQAVSAVSPPLHTPHSPDVCCPSTTPCRTGPGQTQRLQSSVLSSVSASSSLSSPSFQHSKVYVMNVILPAPGIPVLRLFVLEHNCLVPGLSDYKHLYTFKIITIFNN